MHIGAVTLKFQQMTKWDILWDSVVWDSKDIQLYFKKWTESTGHKMYGWIMDDKYDMNTTCSPKTARKKVWHDKSTQRIKWSAVNTQIFSGSRVSDNCSFSWLSWNNGHKLNVFLCKYIISTQTENMSTVWQLTMKYQPHATVHVTT